MSEEQYSFENPEYRSTYWHTCSHVLAQAVKRLYPETQSGHRPQPSTTAFTMTSTFRDPFTADDLEKLEAEMRKICKEKLKLERFELPRAEAHGPAWRTDEPYKVELINDLPDGRRHQLL